ncbi:PDZ domain-containing protein [Halobacteriovorax sp.]|uniref:PDZ domain-containing protein n=1 Tax=Halobacteriovorax sp. TaxID=2020862 RepID=UPI0035615440
MKLAFLLFVLFSLTSFSNEIDDTLNKARDIKLKASESKGFLLKDISTGSIYEKLGLKSNDKITQINGKKVNNLSDVVNGMANVKSITVFREGKEKELNYSIQD